MFDSKDDKNAQSTSQGKASNIKDQVVIIGNLEIHPPRITFSDIKSEYKEYALEIAEHSFSIV